MESRLKELRKKTHESFRDIKEALEKEAAGGAAELERVTKQQKAKERKSQGSSDSCPPSSDSEPPKQKKNVSWHQKDVGQKGKVAAIVGVITTLAILLKEIAELLQAFK